MKSDVVARSKVLLPSHVPAFVREEYPLFMAFLEAFYEWMATAGGDSVLASMKDNIDIDTAVESFIPFFQSTYITDLPTQMAADPRHFMKFAKEFYQSKGTEHSFKMFIRAIFNENVDVYYPRENLFIPSEAWYVTKTVMLTETLNLSGFEGYSIKGSVSGATARIEHATEALSASKRYSRLVLVDQVGEFNPTEVVKISNGVQFTILPTSKPAIKTNTKNDWKDGDLFMVPATYPVPVRTFSIYRTPIESVSIVAPGTGYSIGQKFYIESTDRGTGAELMVSAVDGSGGITAVDLLRKGFNYNVVPTIFKTDGAGSGAQFSVTAMNSWFGKMRKIQLLDSLPHPNGVSTVEVTVATGASIELTPSATVQIYEYKNQTGFISDVYFIHDSSYYQNFSYEIQSRIDLTEYKEVLKRCLHPAGTKQFIRTSMFWEDVTSISESAVLE